MKEVWNLRIIGGKYRTDGKAKKVNMKRYYGDEVIEEIGRPGELFCGRHPP